ncbi:hypothetical protein [Pseudomonas sp. 382]|uniref:hypothetical protein n=1 Tax=Pseudomonas sp. 382 TaxID=1751969 RepID=UPI000C17A737|nr:hypothetical protein [Pseudomonas sp. 382]PIK75006.1 hypothetical protein CQW31_29625 [Pseudomonas sp. 382]
MRIDLPGQLDLTIQVAHQSPPTPTGSKEQLAERDALLCEADEFMYIMTGHDSHARLAHKYGEKWWDAIDKLRGKVCTALSSGAEPQVKS